jgi:hypothetical protein
MRRADGLGAEFPDELAWAGSFLGMGGMQSRAACDFASYGGF